MFVCLIKNTRCHASYHWPPAKLCSATLTTCIEYYLSVPFAQKNIYPCTRFLNFLKKVYINIYGLFSNCSNFYSSQTQKCPGHCFGAMLLNLQTVCQWFTMVLWANFQPIRTNLSMHIFPTLRTSYTWLPCRRANWSSVRHLCFVIDKDKPVRDNSYLYLNLNLNLNIVMSAKSFGTSRQLSLLSIVFILHKLESKPISLK